jgi:hypothetical protein
MRPIPYWATVLAIGASLALRVDLRIAIAMPLSASDLRGLQTCGAVSPTGVLRVVHQRIADRCAQDWLASQLPVDGDAGWTKRLRAAFDEVHGDDVWQLRIAELIVHQDGSLPPEAGPLLRRHPDDPVADAVLAGSHRGAAWIDPILDDRRAAMAWARDRDRPADAVALIDRQLMELSPHLPVIYDAGLRDLGRGLQLGLHTEEGSRGRESAATAGWSLGDHPGDLRELRRALVALQERDAETQMGTRPQPVAQPLTTRKGADRLLVACGDETELCTAWIQRFGSFVRHHPDPAAALAQLWSGPSSLPITAIFDRGGPWRVLRDGTGPPCTVRWMTLVIADLAGLDPKPVDAGVQIDDAVVPLAACLTPGTPAEAAIAELAAQSSVGDDWQYP